MSRKVLVFAGLSLPAAGGKVGDAGCTADGNQEWELIRRGNTTVGALEFV